MTWWMRPGPSRFCAIRNPAPSAPSSVRDRHADARVPNLAVRRPALAGVTHDRDRTHDVDARSVRRDDDLRRARVGAGVGVGHRHHDPERSAVGAGREPLVPVDHPVVAVADSARSEGRRVGAGHLRLGHREERTDLAGDERCEPSLLLLVGAEEVEDLGVSGVGRLAPEDELAPHRAADVLVQIRIVEKAGAAAAGLGRNVRRPQPELAHLVLQHADECLSLPRPAARSPARSAARARP